MKRQVKAHFEKQAQACDRMGSPFTAQLCRLLPDLLDPRTRTGARVSAWPGDPGQDALALRLCGGLHALVLAGKDAQLAGVYPPNKGFPEGLRAAVADALSRHDERLSQALNSPPQTNEIARSAILLPGFLVIARETGLPLELLEIGSSAGLNLLLDRFHYRYGDQEWGDPASPVRLAPEVRGKPPELDGTLDIAARLGSDIAPIDVSVRDERLRLMSYVWADQVTRLQRLAAAIDMKRLQPTTVVKKDAARFVREKLAVRRTDRASVLSHSIMWQYLPQETRDEIEAVVQSAGMQGKAPLAWLRMEPGEKSEPFAWLSLTLWPQGVRRDLARCDFHGRWIEWLG